MNPKCKVVWLGEIKPDDPRYREGWSIMVGMPKKGPPLEVKPAPTTPSEPPPKK